MFWVTKESLPFFNRFKFKKLKSMPARDGIAYECDLWFDNHKIGHVENDGKGGMTMIDYTEDGKDFIKSLDVPQYYNKEEINFRINTEYIISDLVEVKLYLQDMLKKQTKTIFFLSKDDKIMQVNYRYSFNKIKASGQIHLIKKRVKAIIDDGGTILNTNLERLGL